MLIGAALVVLEHWWGTAVTVVVISVSQLVIKVVTYVQSCLLVYTAV
jgi:hypothetical protein